MDERDAELGAHERELLGAEVGPVVDEQACGEASAGDGVFEHGQECGGVFGEGEGGEGDDPGWPGPLQVQAAVRGMSA